MRPLLSRGHRRSARLVFSSAADRTRQIFSHSIRLSQRWKEECSKSGEQSALLKIGTQSFAIFVRSPLFGIHKRQYNGAFMCVHAEGHLEEVGLAESDLMGGRSRLPAKVGRATTKL